MGISPLAGMLTTVLPNKWAIGEGVVMSRSDVLKALDKWVSAGLIDEEQARAIQRHEATAVEGELPGWVEPVAYLGAALVAVALFLFGVQIWDQLAPTGRLLLATLMTLILFVVGLVMRVSKSPGAGRAASFSWFLTVAGVAATTGLIVFDIVDLDADWAPLLVEATAMVSAVALYVFNQRTMQQVAIAVSTASLLATIPGLLPLGEEGWVTGLLFLVVGAIWLLLTWARLLHPPAAGWVLGALFSISVGFGAFDGNAFWSGLGILVGLGLVWLSTQIEKRSLLALGVLALVIWIPTTVTILFEESIAVPVAILITGVVTLTVVVAAIRLGRRPSQQGLPGGTDGAS